MPNRSQPENTIAYQTRRVFPELSPAERKLMRLILTAGFPPPLGRVADLADYAGVSAPTVLRTVAKLGFSNYSSFRQRAVRELSKKGTSALSQMHDGNSKAEEGLIKRMSSQLGELVISTLQSPDVDEISRAVKILADRTFKQVFAGGKFSHSVAEQLFLHSQLIRPGCDLIFREQQQRKERTIDIGRSHALTVFDFRRYQRDTIELANEVKQRRAKVILVTDQWMSPIADIADVVLVVEVQCASPFDTLVPAFALTEILIAGIYERLQNSAATRLSQLEELGTGHIGTAGFIDKTIEEKA